MIIDLDECQKDSPVFRQCLDVHEKSLDSLENKLEKVIKQCSQTVSSGKLYAQDQEQLIRVMCDLSIYFADDTAVQSSINSLLECLREVASYQKTLVEQTNRAIVEHLSGYIKKEVKQMKDVRHNFEKSSAELDSASNKVAGYTKGQDIGDLDSQVMKIRKAFRHNAIDYVRALSLAQEKKRYEVVYSLLSYTKAYCTFYHQGTDLCNDLKPTFDKISQDVNTMNCNIEKMTTEMKNIHFEVSGKDFIPKKSPDNSVTMQGYLFKRSNNAFKTWNYRYFTLQNNKLVYQKRSGEEVTIMEEDMRLCNVKPAIDSERRFCFEITSNTKTHMLQAESEESCKEWVSTLNRAIASALNDSSLMTRHSSYDSIIDQMNNSITSSPAFSPSSDFQHNVVWHKLRQITGNDICCDCYSPNPKWASINLGITLCIECSGIHRSLGVHRSKVRSLTLDNWEDEVMYVMEELGNSVINDIYLAQYSNDDMPVSPSSRRSLKSSIVPASEHCDRAIREEWIKTKYLEKRFVINLQNDSKCQKVLNNLKTKKRRMLQRKQKKFGDNVSIASSDFPSSSSSSETPSGSMDDLTSPDTPEGTKRFETKENDIWDIEKISSMTPNEILLKASEISCIPMMALALANGADKNCRCIAKNRTPLHYAVLSGSGTAIEFLLQNGSLVNEQDDNYTTPLHLAAAENNIFQAYRLLISKANHKLKDKLGKTPLEYAIETNEPHLVTLLRVATLSDQLDKDTVDEEMKAIMVEISHKRTT